MFSKEEKQKFITTLDEKFKKVSSSNICPMCKTSNFILADAYFRNGLQENLNEIKLDAPNIPSIAIICTNCGFISQHSIGVLGLLKNE